MHYRNRSLVVGCDGSTEMSDFAVAALPVVAEVEAAVDDEGVSLPSLFPPPPNDLKVGFGLFSS